MAYVEDRMRGKVHTPHLAAQLRDFSGMRFGKLTPTDIDGLQDFGDRLVVLYEMKLAGVKMEWGQELALQRFTDGMLSPKRHSLGLVAEHTNREGVIDLASCIVVKYRWRRRWRFPLQPITVRQAVELVLKECGLTQYLNE